jgi:hypothetical protein
MSNGRDFTARKEPGAEEAFVPEEQGTLFPSRDGRIAGAMETEKAAASGSKLPHSKKARTLAW